MMNERIRELAEQAGITTNLDTDYFEKDINKWIDYYSEKFAELIVREVFEIIDDEASYTIYAPVVQLVKERFGINDE